MACRDAEYFRTRADGIGHFVDLGGEDVAPVPVGQRGRCRAGVFEQGATEIGGTGHILGDALMTVDEVEQPGIARIAARLVPGPTGQRVLQEVFSNWMLLDEG